MAAISILVYADRSGAEASRQDFQAYFRCGQSSCLEMASDAVPHMEALLRSNSRYSSGVSRLHPSGFTRIKAMRAVHKLPANTPYNSSVSCRSRISKATFIKGFRPFCLFSWGPEPLMSRVVLVACNRQKQDAILRTQSCGTAAAVAVRCIKAGVVRGTQLLKSFDGRRPAPWRVIDCET